MTFLQSVINRLCGLVVQHPDRQARGREFEPRNPHFSTVCGSRPHTVCGLHPPVWPQATNIFFVALGHSPLCGRRPQYFLLRLQAPLWLMCGYRPHYLGLWLQATLEKSVATGHAMMICGYRAHTIIIQCIDILHFYHQYSTDSVVQWYSMRTVKQEVVSSNLAVVHCFIVCGPGPHILLLYQPLMWPQAIKNICGSRPQWPQAIECLVAYGHNQDLRSQKLLDLWPRATRKNYSPMPLFCMWPEATQQ